MDLIIGGSGPLTQSKKTEHDHHEQWHDRRHLTMHDLSDLTSKYEPVAGLKRGLWGGGRCTEGAGK